MAQNKTGEKVVSITVVNPKGVSVTKVVPLVVVDGKVVADTEGGVVQ